MRAVIYARYSSDNQRRESIEDQLEVCRRYITRMGWTLTGTYDDPAMSGSSRFRPGFQKLLADAEERRFDVVVCEALDRLSRKLADTADFYDRLTFRRVRLYTTSMGEITTMHIGVIGMMAQSYISDLKEKGIVRATRLETSTAVAYRPIMTQRSPFRYFKTSPEIIRLAVMMYIRFPLSLRNVEDLLHERGIDICHETVRFWWNRFGPMFAAEIRKRRVEGLRSSRWRWHLDEVFVRINGERHYLWRAVDHEGEVLESFVTKAWDKKAALKFLRKSLKRHGHAEEVVTDGLGSYGAALRELGIRDRQQTGRWTNNRAENSHQPFRRRERAMLRFRRMRTLQKFASVHASIHNHFNQERSLYSRTNFKLNRNAALAEWRGLCAE